MVDCENHLILAIFLKIIIINIILITSKFYVVNNMTKPLSELIDETTKSSSLADYSVKNGLIESQKLLGSSGKIAIEHRGEIYQLRQTRTGKLILTK
ncbi:hemin uptake protein HemP [Providencia alcalifaciens]|nr:MULTISPECIES: hemin uptake protein HemP [Providencia]WGZ56160.1 hemin uptake protein HemP [Providencia alcalifaciens]